MSYDMDTGMQIAKQRDHELLGRYLLDLDNDLGKMKDGFLARRYNPRFGNPREDGATDWEEHLYDNDSAFVNNMGANKIDNLLRTHLLKIVQVTNLDENKIQKELIIFDEIFGEFLFRNHQKFALSAGDYMAVHNSGVHLLIAALNSSKAGFKAQLTLKNTDQREIINNTESMQASVPKLRRVFGGGI